MSELSIIQPGVKRKGFFTDTSVCIGCKACEVACKQWNDLPTDGGEFRKGGSYDSTGQLAANTWRHVRFVEIDERRSEDCPTDGGIWTCVHVRRLQALHPRRLHGRVPDRAR